MHLSKSQSMASFCLLDRDSIWPPGMVREVASNRSDGDNDGNESNAPPLEGSRTCGAPTRIRIVFGMFYFCFRRVFVLCISYCMRMVLILCS